LNAKVMYKLKQSTLYILFVVTIVFGCSPHTPPPKISNVCTNEWFAYIESQLVTGDSQGHGPDLGSYEWRSVVEFKLGIREDNKVPELNTEKWCVYIDDLVNATH